MSDSSHKNIKILVVEDDVISQITLVKMLNNMGFDEVDIVNDGDKALDKLAETNYDIVIMDIFIKGDQNGIEVTRAIKSAYDIPVLYLSASSDYHTFKQAMAGPNDGFLRKPYDYQKIFETIKKLVL